MKKRLLAMLMVLMLVVSLLPVGALAANDASATSSNGYFDISYQNDGLYERTINVNLIINGSTIDTLTVSDAILGSQRVTISLNDPFSSKYDIENVITDGFDGAAPSLLADSYSVQVSNISSNDPAIINLYLIEYEDPEVSEVITGQGVTRTYRIYDDQVYKMLYSQGVDVTEETTVVSVTPLWVRSFGTESNKGLIHENLETDYWDNSFTSNSADVDEVQPTNIKGISITYDNGSGEETVTVSSGDLKFNVSGIAGSRYYVIELNDNSFHIVYFYNEEGALVGNAYTLYAIRFVNHGESLGSKMPSDPTYPATTYEFVGWTYGYDGGSPFLGTTPVNEDTVVYAQKTLSSNASEIHVMNNDDLLKERIQELYGEADIDWDSIKISVYAGTEHTNPDYNLSPYSNGWRDEDSYYFVYNYLTGAGQQENESIYINDITHIAVTAKDTDGKDLGEVIINKGVYDGDFAVSTGSQGSSYIIELYIIDNGIQPPEPEPEEYTLTTSADENSTIDVGKTYEYSENGTIEVKFTANSGYAIDTVTVDNRKLDGDELAAAIENGCVVVDMKGDHSVAVTSSAKTYRLSYKWDSDFYDEAELPPAEEHKYGETISLSDMYEVGDTITTEKYVYEFRGWKYGGKPVTEITMPASDIFVEGKWINKGEAPKYNVTYEFEGDAPESFTPNIDNFGIFKDSHFPGSIQNVPTGLEAESEDGTWTFNGWTSEDVEISDDNKFTMPAKDVHLVGTWTFTETKKHPVNIVIYRNGDTDEAYSSTKIGEYAKGETVDLSKLNINDYYSSANGFEFKGWYNDDGWNKYKDGDPDNTLGDSIIVNGWTNIICMVTDYEKVVVKSVIDGDKDNAETIYTGEALHGTNLIEYLEDNVTLEQKPGYELDKWYNWDWYGHEYSDTTTVNGWTNVYVTYTSVEPDAPTVEDLAALKLKVQIDCIDLGVHPNRDYAIEEGTFTTEIELVNGVWQCDLSVQGSDYLTKYNSEFGKHEFSGSSTKAKTLVYGATGWTLENPGNDRIVFDVKCVEPDAPTYDVLKDMIKVQIDCINKEVSHSNADYDLIENSYDLGTLTANADGTWSCTLTVKSDAYVAKYNETKPGHTLVDAYASKDIELVYSVDGKWSRADTSNNIAAVFDVKCEAIPATPITPLPTEGDIAELIDGKIIVDCVNDDVNHANKNYGLVDDALMNVAMTDSTTVKVTLSANVYLAKYNDDDTSAKHSLADGQSETVTITLKYVDDEWTLPADAGELPATIKVVCETPVTPEPTPDITGFTKELVTDRRVYWNNGIAYPEFYRGDVIVDEGDSVTLIYKLTVTGTEGTEYTLSDAGAEKLSGSWSGTLGADGTASVYVSKTFSWKTIRNSDALYNTAYVYIAGEDDPVESDTVKIDVDIDWDYDPPADDDDDTVYVPNWLNTTDHFAYLIGYEDGEIKPENNITRAEVATIFFRLLTDDARARFWSSENDYTDVATDSWYNNAISTLSNMGIINGYEDGSFQPNASITRAEFTAIATRFFDYTAEYDGAFNDVASGSWYADYVQAAVDMGLVDGYPDGGFHPNSYITRAEAVTIVNRVLNRVPHEDYLLSTRVMNTWPDNVYGAWYYADMQEATNSHDYDWIRVNGERVEEWTEKLTERDWAALEQEWSTAYSG